MLNLYIIGGGGIGGYLIDILPRTLASLSLDMMPKNRSARHMQNAGSDSIPLIADSLTIVDGDTFDAGNALRQGEGIGSKTRQRLHRLVTQGNDVLLTSWLRNLELIGWERYINPLNMDTIIPHTPKQNTANIKAHDIFPFKLNIPVVFLCVDNKKTRYEISRYMQSFDNCLLINGGNDKTAGHVTLHERRDGRNIDPTLTEMYPDITDTADTRPDERHCQDIAPSQDQVANTNAVIAIWMSIAFNNWVRAYEQQKEGHTNEIIINTERYTTVGIQHARDEGDR